MGFRSIILFFVAICLGFGNTKLNSKKIRIIHGVTLDPPHSLPYQVLLILGSDPLYDLRFCGGVLISEEWVLTSGNCTDGSLAEDCEAFLGQQNISKEEDELQFSFVTDYITHFEFDPYFLTSNIGLVHLTTPAVFNDSVQAISLTTKNQTASKLVGQTGIISGWGTQNTSDFDKLTYVLQTATTTILDKSKCTQSNDELDLSTHICAQSDTNAHIYGADFGGPLVVNGSLVGIASTWTGNSSDSDLFTDVRQYLTWISEITGIPIS